MFGDLWLGAIDGFNKGNFTWWSSGKEVGYTNWKVGQPEVDQHQHCVNMQLFDGKWDALECNITQMTTGTYCETKAPIAGIFIHILIKACFI